MPNSSLKIRLTRMIFYAKSAFPAIAGKALFKGGNDNADFLKSGLEKGEMSRSLVPCGPISLQVYD